MNNYYNFTKLIEDGNSYNIYDVMSNDKLIEILDGFFNDIDNDISYAAKTFKMLFKGRDYDEFYYSLMELLENINDIKIIINILGSRQENE